MEIEATTPEAWGELVELLMGEPERESRAGDMRELRTVTVRSDDPRERWLVRDGDWNLAFQLQEMFAYWMGLNPGHVERYGNMDRWLDDDGRLPGSAYGDRMRHSAGHDQLGRAEAQIRDSPGTRRAVVQVHQAAEEDWDSNDVSCTSHLHFLARDGELHCKASLRSQDVFWGYCYDAANNQWLQEALAGRLGLELGEYHHVMDSAHLYTRFEDGRASAAVGESRAGSTPDMRLEKNLHDEVMEELDRGLARARSGSIPSDCIRSLETYGPAGDVYADWLRVMTAYEKSRFHGEKGMARRLAADVSTRPWADWIYRYAAEDGTARVAPADD